MYQGLVSRGVTSLANDACGEGLAKARSLKADCYYRMANCHAALQQFAEAVDMLKRHLTMRGPGCRSIYPIQMVHAELARAKLNVIGTPE